MIEVMVDVRVVRMDSSVMMIGNGSKRFWLERIHSQRLIAAPLITRRTASTIANRKHILV